MAFVLFAVEQKRLIRKKELQLESTFQGFMLSLAAALRAGYSLPNGFGEAYKEMLHMYGANQFLVTGLARILRGIKEGKRCEDMLEEVGRQLRCNSMEELGRTLKVATKTGGNMNKVLCRTVQTLQQNYALLQDIEDGMAGRKYEAKIMEVLPFLLLFYVELGNPGFFDGLFGRIDGIVVMSGCLVVFLIAKVWMEWIVSSATEV